MVVYVMNTAAVANSAAPFTEERLEGIRKLFNGVPTYDINLRGSRLQTIEFLDARGTQLKTSRLNTFLSFVAGFSVVLFPATDFTILPQGWEYVKMISLTKSFYHTADVDSSAVAVSHHCKLLNSHQLLARVGSLRRQGRPTITSNYMSRENDTPTTPTGYKALMRNMIADTMSWSEFLFEKVLVDIDRKEGISVIVKGRLASNTARRTNGVMRTPYVFTARVLHGIMGVDLGDLTFRDIELREDMFVLQWVKTAMNHLSEKVPGMQQRLNVEVMDHSENKDDA